MPIYCSDEDRMIGMFFVSSSMHGGERKVADGARGQSTTIHHTLTHSMHAGMGQCMTGVMHGVGRERERMSTHVDVG